MAAMIALVALRMGTGWHFFKEGSKKFRDPEFSSAFLFEGATGPLQDFYLRLIPDRGGRERLNLDKTIERWERFTREAISHYGLNAERQKLADRELNRQKEVLRTYFAERRGEMDQYFRELDRLEELRQAKASRRIDYSRSRLRQMDAQLKATRSQWLGDLETLADYYESALHQLGEEQRPGVSRLAMDDPGAMWIDGAVKYVITGVGVCLILGMFTRLAALVGAGFLLTVMATQPPWVADASLTFFYYQLVEVFALGTLGAFAAGRYAGLDYVLAGWWSGCCGSRNR